jgi:hypothetical protein
MMDRLRGLVWLYVGLVAVGLVAAAVKRRYVVVDSWPLQPSRSTTRNLAHLNAGTQLSVSSFDAARNGIHPLYAIDGDPAPPLSWASDPTDRKPWLRLRLAKRSDIDTLQLAHVRSLSQAAPRGYKVICLRDSMNRLEPVVQQHVVNDSWNGTLQHLDCKGVDEFRIEFDASETETNGKVGLYEITLIGRAQ